MKKTTLIASLCIIASFYSCKKKSDDGVKQINTTVSITPKDAAWTLDKDRSDEFSALDTTKWSAAPLWYPTTEDLAFKTANTTVINGVASLMAKKEGYNGSQYTAGCLKSKFLVGGDTYIEIRAKMVKKTANICAAIWLGDDPTEVNNPNIEIDMQETKEAETAANRVNSSLLTWPKPGSSNTVPGSSVFYLAKTLDEDFHLYGLERRNGKLSFYIDGINYWVWDASATPEFVTEPRPIILSQEGHSGTPVDSELPADFQIDWVRVYNAK
jgi:hypothetical protein